MEDGKNGRYSNIFQPGQTILEGQYKVIKKLGRGSFGEVYQVQKINSGEIFAAKVERYTINIKIHLENENNLMNQIKNSAMVP